MLPTPTQWRDRCERTNEAGRRTQAWPGGTQQGRLPRKTLTKNTSRHTSGRHASRRPRATPDRPPIEPPGVGSTRCTRTRGSEEERSGSAPQAPRKVGGSVRELAAFHHIDEKRRSDAGPSGDVCWARGSPSGPSCQEDAEQVGVLVFGARSGGAWPQKGRPRPRSAAVIRCVWCGFGEDAGVRVNQVRRVASGLRGSTSSPNSAQERRTKCAEFQALSASSRSTHLPGRARATPPLRECPDSIESSGGPDISVFFLRRRTAPPSRSPVT